MKVGAFRIDRAAVDLLLVRQDRFACHLNDRYDVAR